MTSPAASAAASPDVFSVLVVDDHRTFADLLALALSGQPDLACVGTANSVAQGLALAEQLRPDVVVMDVQLGDGDGIAATAELTARDSRVRVVVLTAHTDQALLERAAAAGACSLMPKDGSLSDMLQALRAAHRNGFVVHPSLLKTLMGSRRPAGAAVPVLTPREQDVLRMLADGLDARAIGHRLGISVHTCRGYVKNLLAKLGAHSQLQAVALARRHGLLDGHDDA